MQVAEYNETEWMTENYTTKMASVPALNAICTMDDNGWPLLSRQADVTMTLRQGFYSLYIIAVPVSDRWTWEAFMVARGEMDFGAYTAQGAAPTMRTFATRRDAIADAVQSQDALF